MKEEEMKKRIFTALSGIYKHGLIVKQLREKIGIKDENPADKRKFDGYIPILLKEEEKLKNVEVILSKKHKCGPGKAKVVYLKEYEDLVYKKWNIISEYVPIEVKISHTKKIQDQIIKLLIESYSKPLGSLIDIYYPYSYIYEEEYAMWGPPYINQYKDEKSGYIQVGPNCFCFPMAFSEKEERWFFDVELKVRNNKLLDEYLDAFPYLKDTIEEINVENNKKWELSFNLLSEIREIIEKNSNLPIVDSYMVSIDDYLKNQNHITSNFLYDIFDYIEIYGIIPLTDFLPAPFIIQGPDEKYECVSSRYFKEICFLRINREKLNEKDISKYFNELLEKISLNIFHSNKIKKLLQDLSETKDIIYNNKNKILTHLRKDMYREIIDIRYNLNSLIS